MVNASLAPPSVLPDPIEVDVRAYDQAELTLLQNSSQWPAISAVCGHTVQVEKEQLLVYSMFRDLDICTPVDLHEDVVPREKRLLRLLSPSGNHFNAKPALVPDDHGPQAEELGEALALCIADEIFGTNEQDWQRIGKTTKKTFDWVASTGTLQVEWEAKGSFLDDSQLVSPSVSNHKKSIKDKKASLGPVPANALRLGSIAMIGKNTAHKPVVRLVDPPAEADDLEPRVRKLVHRMRFLTHWITFLKPRSPLAAALRTRERDIETITNPFELDGVPLVNGNGEVFNLDPYDVKTGKSRFFSSLSVVTDGPTGGHVVVLDKNWLFFFGIMDDLLYLAAEQSFTPILEYERGPGTVSKTIRCVFSRGRFDRAGVGGNPLNKNSEAITSIDEGYVHFEAEGEIHYTVGGLAFGWLRRPQDL